VLGPWPGRCDASFEWYAYCDGHTSYYDVCPLPHVGLRCPAVLVDLVYGYAAGVAADHMGIQEPGVQPTLPRCSAAQQQLLGTSSGSMGSPYAPLIAAGWFIAGIFVIMTVPITVYEVGTLPHTPTPQGHPDQQLRSVFTCQTPPSCRCTGRDT
jgi:hypothetical protein